MRWLRIRAKLTAIGLSLSEIRGAALLFDSLAATLTAISIVQAIQICAGCLGELEQIQSAVLKLAADVGSAANQSSIFPLLQAISQVVVSVDAIKKTLLLVASCCVRALDHLLHRFQTVCVSLRISAN